MKKLKKKMNKVKRYLKTIVIIAIVTMNMAIAEAKVYQANSDLRVNVEISNLGVNRIEVKKDRITKVVGNINEYSIEGDNKTGVIFISASAIEGEILPITIITEKGFTQDINLIVTKGNEPKSIILEKPKPKETKQTVSPQKDLKEQVIEAVKQISKGDDRNYTKRDIPVKEIINYEKHQKSQEDLRENVIFSGYRELQNKQISVNKVTQYSNREIKIICFEYEDKPSDIGIKEINKIFKDALSVGERGNVIMVVYKS